MNIDLLEVYKDLYRERCYVNKAIVNERVKWTFLVDNLLATQQIILSIDDEEEKEEKEEAEEEEE